MSKGQEKGRGHSPSGSFGHGGHFKKDFSQAGKGPETDHMVQAPPSAMGGGMPMGGDTDKDSM